MIETKYKPVPEKLCSNYFNILINKFYKILPLKEENSSTVDQYITSLLAEMTGGREVIKAIQHDGLYLMLVNTLEYLRYCDDLKVCKREVFKCIKTIESLNSKYFGR